MVVCCFLGEEKLEDYSRCPSWKFTDRISLPLLTVHIALLWKAALRKKNRSETQDSDIPELSELNGPAIG